MHPRRPSGLRRSVTVFLYLALAVFGMEMAAITATTHTLTATLMADRALFSATAPGHRLQ